nr:MAG TPA: hypothetical protein [Caudoviricetes sp.]
MVYLAQLVQLVHRPFRRRAAEGARSACGGWEKMRGCAMIY